MTRKSVLGKGLSALIQAADVPGLAAGTAVVKPLPLDQIAFNPDQPRKVFDEDRLSELADSIRQVGVLQPVLVRETTIAERETSADGDGAPRYVVVAGERRVRAARLAGLAAVPALICTYAETEALKVALLENIQRQDLGPIEEADAYQRLLDAYGATQEELAGMLGKSRSGIANALRLLSLEDNIQELVQSGKLSRGHAKVLLGMPAGPSRLRLAQLCVSRGLSVRECERRVQIAGRSASGKRRSRRAAAAARTETPALRELRQRTEARLGTPVSIDRGGDGRGQLVVTFYSDDDLERLLELMGVPVDLG